MLEAKNEAKAEAENNIQALKSAWPRGFSITT